MMFSPRIFCVITLLCLVEQSLTGQVLSPGPQVLTFFSAADDTEQPYGLYIPENYDAQKKYPLVIMLHGAGSNHRLALRRVFGKSNAPGENDVEATRYFPEWKNIDFIVASPFARGTAGYQGIPEKDVYDVLADVKKRFSIDEDRIYLTGLSMGGGGTLWIGLTRPDIWAALAPVCPAPPRGTDQLAANALNIPVHFYHGAADRVVPPTVSREWTKRLKELGCHVEHDEYPGVEHNSWKNAYRDQAVFKWLGQHKRNPYPDQVKFNTLQYKYNKAYWVHLDLLTPGTLATIDARFSAPNQLEITTSNLGGFTLTLANHPQYKAGQPLQVTLNSKKIKLPPSDSISFTLKNGKWATGKYEASGQIKKPRAEGPINAAFADRHIYVYGTGGNPSEQELKARMDIAIQAANWSVYRNAFLGRIMFFPRVVADKDVRPSDLETSNLILFGTKETNTVIKKYADQLPMHLNPSTPERGLFYIFPLNGRYMVVNSGLSWWTAREAQGFAFLPQPYLVLPGFKDYIVFKGDGKTILTEGYFDQQWALSPQQVQTLNDSGVLVK